MSWLNTLLHPINASIELEQLRLYASQMETYTQAIEQQLAQLQADNAALQQQIADLTAQQLATAQQLETARTQRSDYLDRLNQAELRAAQIDEIEQTLSRFESLKQKYISRIETLKTQLAQTRQALHKAAIENTRHTFATKIPDGELSEIRFSAPPPQPSKTQVHQPSLFDAATAKTTPQPADTPADDNDDNWLRPLPD